MITTKLKIMCYMCYKHVLSTSKIYVCDNHIIKEIRVHYHINLSTDDTQLQIPVLT
jgi:hypothetical protein